MTINKTARTLAIQALMDACRETVKNSNHLLACGFWGWPNEPDGIAMPHCTCHIKICVDAIKKAEEAKL